MSHVNVIELITQSEKIWEDAAQRAINEVSK
ncbi:MAG: dodecin domain-containing protein [Limisphaerales bacterium]